MIKTLHPRLQLTRTMTGRLAASGFPVLGLPKHSAEGKRIRDLIRAPEGWLIYEIDYSQIEMRVAAELSRDPELIDVYRKGEDIHSKTAHRCLHAPKEKAKQDDSKHRLPAKTVNFSMLMGTSPKGLTESIHRALSQRGYPLDWSKDCPGCKSFKADHLPTCDSVVMMREWFALYKGVRAFMDDRRAQATKTGKAYGMWGMEWSLPGVYSPHEEVREATLRQSHALPIQEGAQRLLKKAMAAVSKILPDRSLVKPFLQYHDALEFVVKESYVPTWHRRVKQVMEYIASWCIPIVAEGKAGPTWLDLKSL